MTKTGIVLQVEKDKAILMTASGEFVKVKLSSKAPKAGETYTGKIYKKNNLMKYTAAVACLLFIFLSGGGAYAYYSPVATVQVSINPSLELKLNRFNRIIKYVPLNKDGEVLLSHLNIKNTAIEDGLYKIIEEAKKENFINDNYVRAGKVISIKVTSGNKHKSLKLSKFEKYIADNNLNLNLKNNGKEINLEHGKTVKDPKKDVPLDNEKDKGPQKNSDSNNDSGKKNNNTNAPNKNNDNNGNTNSNSTNIDNNSDNNNKATNEKKNDSNKNNNPNMKKDHPSNNPGNHTPDPGKSKKK